MIAAGVHAETKTASPAVIAAAWAITGIVSALPDILLQELTGTVPAWLVWAKVVLLALLVILSTIWQPASFFRPYLGMLILVTLGWWLLGWFRRLPGWAGWEARSPWLLGMAGIQVLKAGIALVVIAFLLWMKQTRQAVYLVKGQLRAVSDPVRWLGMNQPTTWVRFGTVVGLCSFFGGVIFLALTNPLSQQGFSILRAVLPGVILLSASNAINEEIVFRSGLLSSMPAALGKRHLLAMNAVFFGLAHYSGTFPTGLIWFALTALLGWLFAKGMLETKGLFWPWLLHFVSDLPVLAFTAVASITARGF